MDDRPLGDSGPGVRPNSLLTQAGSIADALMPGAASVLATLVADSGHAAGSDDFFRYPSLLAAERVTQSLEGGDALAAAPVIVQQIPDCTQLCDITSPYGYQGVKADGAVAVETGRIQWPDGRTVRGVLGLAGAGWALPVYG